MNPNIITFSYPTVGPSGAEQPAATYSFLTRDYKPPAQGRSLGFDIVHNQNGKFKYVYDNGPNFYSWEPFQLVLDDTFSDILGTATTQWNNLEDIWGHQDNLLMAAPDGGVYDVHWAAESLEREFIKFPSSVGDKIEYAVTVQFEEAS